MTTTTRTVHRQWTRTGARVATVHPQHGELDRGRVETVPGQRHDQGRGAWRLVDQDHEDRGVMLGDYLDAEARLLDLTTWADEPDAEPGDEQGQE